jgi:YD repeat-containing protein
MIPMRFLRTTPSFPRANIACESPLREDTNGNEISYSTTSGWTDTVGRSIPVPLSTTNYTGCTGVFAITSAQIWNLPGPTGESFPLKFCYASVPTKVGYATVAFGDTSYTINMTQIQSVILPDGKSWTFQYTATGDLGQITFPTGGTLSYAWQSVPSPWSDRLRLDCKSSTPEQVTECERRQWKRNMGLRLLLKHEHKPAHNDLGSDRSSRK